MDFEENSPFQEGGISDTHQRPDKSQFPRTHKKLDSLIYTGRASTEVLTKASLYRQNIKDYTKKKFLKGMHLPVTVKEIQAGILNQPIFQGTYICT